MFKLETPRVECTFNETNSVLSCLTPANGSVDCQAFGRFEQYQSRNFKFYGLSATPVGDVTFPDTLLYSLYPQLGDGQGWLNSTFQDSLYGNLSYSLYYGPDNVRYGFRVNDQQCWRRLVKLFTAITHTESILVGTDHVVQEDIIGVIVFS